MTTTRLSYGRYLLRAAPMGSTFVARAFLEGAPQGSGIVAEASGPSAETALDALRIALDERDARRLGDRRPLPGHPNLTVPTSDEYRDALTRLRPTDAQWAMLRHHAAAGGDGSTETELAGAAGFPGYSAANLQYGLLGRAVADALGLALPTYSRDPAREVATAALASESDQRRGGHYLWVMHPELVAALRNL